MGMDLFREFELQGNIEEEEEQAAELEAAPLTRQEQREQQTDRNEDEGNPDDDGPSPSSNIFALDALGFRMRFSRRLRKLELMNLPITRDHAESLMYGIETNVTTGTGCRLDTLAMEGVRFVDDGDIGDDEENEDENDENNDNDNDDDDDDDEDNGEGETEIIPTNTPGDGTVVIKELCEGFPNNRTLTTIELQRCRLTDAQIALIFDSLARHPTLTHLNLSENYCRTLGLESLDRMLVSPPLAAKTTTATTTTTTTKTTNDGGGSSSMPPCCCCRIESLDLSYQFTSDETYGTGEHIQLDILTRNCTTRDADNRIYPNLRKLVLQGNQIDDSDMKDLAFLIRHRFPRLEELDLRFNEITTEGLEAFANHSDPNNDNYYLTSNNSSSSSSNNNENKKQYKDHFPPPSSRLRTIRLTNNPLVMTNQTSIVILKLLKIYPELQLIQSNLEWEDGTSIAKYIQHLMDINRAGRVLLLTGNGISSSSSSSSSDNRRPSSTNDHNHLHDDEQGSEEEQRGRQRRQQRQQVRGPIPLGAWPLVLARLTRKARYPHYIPKKNSLNGMYYLVRHGPIIMEQMASRTNNTNNNKDKDNDNNDNEDREQQDRKRKWGDPALGGYATLADFLRCELGAKA